MHPWQQIPYSDYEKHMKNQDVYQLQTLNQIFDKHLRAFQPKTILVLGCGGGNGFEHIDDHVTKRVIGLDINEKYLEICRNLYSGRGYALDLISCDFEGSDFDDIKIDYISCALFLEYVDIGQSLIKIHQMLNFDAILNIVIQRSNNISFVSKTQVESLNVLESIAKEIDEDDFEQTLFQRGFQIASKEIIRLPNGKEFVDYICKVQ